MSFFCHLQPGIQRLILLVQGKRKQDETRMFRKYQVVAGTETEMLRRRLLTSSETVPPNQMQSDTRVRTGRGLQNKKRDMEPGRNLRP